MQHICNEHCSQKDGFHVMMRGMKDIERSDWYKTRPKAIQKRIDEFPPYEKYRLKTSGHVVRLYSYEEEQDGECNTCMVLVLFKDNPNISFERKVFGIKFDDLEKISLIL